MERVLLRKLIEWKEKPDRKPLVLKGVRRSGKTYLVREFGKRCYHDFVYFSFEESYTLSRLFRREDAADRILSDLEQLAGRTLSPEKTLFIFDEIQVCPEAVSVIATLCEKEPGYHFICTGALLDIALQTENLLLMNKVEMLTLHPMNFSEFVRACQSDMLADYLERFQCGDSLPEPVANQLATLLRQYYIVGGMPEAVDTWNGTHSVEEVERVQQAIIDTIELDFARQTPAKDFPKLTAIWHSIPAQLSQENTKFFYGHVRKGWRAKELEFSMEWLLRAGLAYKVCKISEPVVPVESHVDYNAFKLYLFDVGILRKLSRLPYEVVLDATPNYQEFKGSLAENFALCELVNSIGDSLYYWSSGNTAEVDFVLQCGSEIVPVEIKSERRVKARSLAEYRKKYSPKCAVKASMKGELGRGEVLNIPLYLISALERFAQ